MFTTATFDFLRALRANNNKAWFDENRVRWEQDAKAPLLAFVNALRPKLRAIAPRYDASGRSVFRIHRDVRFGKDKSPYKTHLAAQFRHEDVRGPAGEAVHAPGFYLHVAPDGEGEMDGVFGGFGMWQPEPTVVRAIRARMLADPDRWRAASEGLTLTGSSLKRTPPGVDPANPLAADLRRKDFIAVLPFSESLAIQPDFVDQFADACARATPLQAWLCGATGLAF